jgi:isoleucyl-tRNA synthetase
MLNNKLYREIERDKTLQELEKEVLAFWDNEEIFKKVLKKGENDSKFVFYEGPPTANGLPGVHHVLARALKDVVCRYQTMNGRLVERKAGWDTHGLPVEIGAEKELGICSKNEIEECGVDTFNAACKSSVFRYLDDWEAITSRIGYWLDMSDPYVTCDSDYMESVWWLLAKFFDDGLMYRGHKILPYCPRCGTGLSDHEVSQGYRDVEDPSITVRIKLSGRENEYFLVWTTTPWTLLSNVAVALHPEVDYVKVEDRGQFLWLAKPRLEAVFGEMNPPVIESKKGLELAGVEYEPLFRFIEPEKKAWFAINADYVTTEDGTGIVHIAPAFGAEDYEEGLRHNLPLVQLVGADGLIVPEAKPFAGKFFKDADPLILEDLEARGLLFNNGRMTHSYAFCWRCDSPLIQYARGSWYIKTTAFKDKLIAANDKIGWFPPEIGSGRFGEWLRNNIDWAISRERYWATPLPIWVCESCDKHVAVGSRAQLAEMAVEGYKEGMDIHKPFIDGVYLRCPVCGGKMARVPDVIDCWFDSGAMPFAQLHYPFEHKDDFEPEFFPAEFICEGVDQTRGWFYTLLAISTYITGKSPYKRCLVNGLVLDKNGQKMSKRLGNAADPVKVIEDFGADPLRWYLVNTSAPWLPKRFDENGISEVSRIFFDTLRNTYGFFALYANIDRWTPEMPAGTPSMIDIWLKSRLNSLIKEVRIDLDGYQLTHATRKIHNFVVDELSNWFVRLSRKRFWGEGMGEDKLAAFRSLYDALAVVAQLSAPFIPMTADVVWRGLHANLPNAAQSVHLTDFPVSDESAIDGELELDMVFTERVVTMGRNARQTANLKVRQPLSKLFVAGGSAKSLPNWAVELVRRELNVKAVESTELTNLLVYSAKANFKALGPRFGKRMKELSAIVEILSDETIKLGLENGIIHMNLDGEEFSINPSEDLVLSTSAGEGFHLNSEEDLTVALDIELTKELVLEGHAREIVNRIQNTRKEAGFEVTDRIEVGIESAKQITEAVEEHREWICREVLATELRIGEIGSPEFAKDWDVNDYPAKISVKRSR